MAPAPEVTVVIPTRDRWPLLSTHGLRAALLQRDVELEVLVVDDGSRDLTAASLQRIDDPRLRVLRHDTPRGLARARNAGIEEARGTWVAFLDDDDLWSPRKLRLQLDAIQARKASFGYAAAVLLDERLEPFDHVSPPAAEGLARRLLRQSAIPAGASNVVASSEALRALGGFDEGFSHLADWDLWIRLAVEYSAAVSHETLVGYVHHGGNMLMRDSGDVLRETDALATRHGRPENRAGGIDVVSIAEWMAVMYRRVGDRKRASRTLLRAGLRWRRPMLLYRGARGEVLRRLPPLRRRTPAAATGDAPAWVSLYRSAGIETRSALEGG